MCLTNNCCRNFISIYGAPKIACLRLHRSKRERSSLAYSALSKPNTPLCTEMILLVEIQIWKISLYKFKFLEIQVNSVDPKLTLNEHSGGSLQPKECGEGREIWEWTRKRIAWILCVDPL